MTDRLHLDLSRGARGEMIAAALVAVGAPTQAGEDALVAAGLTGATVRVEEVRRAGLLALRLRVAVDGLELGGSGVPWEESDPRDARHVRSPHERIHRRAVPRPRMHDAARRPAAVAASAAAVEGGGPARGPTHDDQRSPGERARGRSGGRPRPPGRVAAWWGGATARPQELVDELKASALSPVVKAVALKSARRAVDSLTSVVGAGALLEGPAAARLYADLVLCAALLDALGPGAVTASPLAVSRAVVEAEGVVGAAGWPSPSPWLLEVLAGVPVVEKDEPVALADVAGAAFAWAVVPRFGARGLATSTKQGFGAGAVDLRPGLAGGPFAEGRAVGVRALLGPPLPVPTRAGERQVAPVFLLEATVPHGAGGARELAELHEELAAAGARGAGAVSEVPLDEGRAGSRLRLRLWAPPAAVDAVVGLLWRAGAADVVTSWVELRSAGVVDVTVPVGRGRTKAGVRVRVVKDGDEVVRVEPDRDDVRAAARKGRASTHEVAAEALAAWQRLSSPGRTRRRKDGDGDAG